MFIFKSTPNLFLGLTLACLLSACASPHTESNTALWRPSQSSATTTPTPASLEWLNKKPEISQSSTEQERWSKNQKIDKYLYDSDRPGLTPSYPKKPQTGIEAHSQWEKSQRYLRRNKND